LTTTVRDMWNAHTYALSLLIATFSCFWVYLKLLLMLLCWFAPPTLLAVSRRCARACVARDRADAQVRT
jgi:hypothetical protein